MKYVAFWMAVIGTATTSACSDPCDACDPGTEFCFVQDGCVFLQNGNLVPFAIDRAGCMPLPAPCVDDVSCACLEEEGFGSGGCVEAAPSALRFAVGCE